MVLDFYNSSSTLWTFSIRIVLHKELRILCPISYIYIYIYIYVFFLFNKTISLFYSLFVFRLCYKIVGLSSLNLAGRGLAGRGLTHLWPAVWAGPGPETCGPGRAWAKYSRSGPGLALSSSLWAWARPGLKNYCGPGPGLDSNC